MATASRLDDSPVRPGHDGISDTGEVMFLNGPRRYLAAPGVALRDISSHLGHARWFQGVWYVVMGNTLFKVDDGSSGAGGEGSAGGGAGSGGGTGSDGGAGGMASSTDEAGMASIRP